MADNLMKAITRGRKDVQTTVKMSPALRMKIDEEAESLGISSMEYIRRACEEKLNLEEGNTKESEIRKIVLEVLEEMDIPYQK
ncbi:MAG: hypothetical protein Q4Q53_08970 [Methanocorpusculum sp.]|nr:hypothetical protein [Methanocorpusculum sp.]